MAKRAKRKSLAGAAANYTVKADWTPADLAHLKDMHAREERLPLDAPRALLSVRLSVFTDDTTSPVRQELDLRALALEKGYRVVGVASDLGVSALKVPPWKRKSLGDWINNRLPEFDALLFWKLDRFIRNVGDLHQMMNWAERYERILVSKHDPIDMSTTLGKIVVTFIGGVAEIEAANTRTRVESLWEYTKGQDQWLVGKPAYGYTTIRDDDDNVKLVIDEDAARAIRRAYDLIVRQGLASRAVTQLLVDEGLTEKQMTTAVLIRRLRNPALMGIRVEVDKTSHVRRSKPVFDKDGKHIRVGDPILTRDEFDALQAALDSRGKNQPPRARRVTKLLGVLKCANCNTNMIVHASRNKSGDYAYLKCQGCKSGGYGAPHPEAVYEAATLQILEVLGNHPVETREYARGAAARQAMQEKQESVTYYMQGLAPGGRFTKTAFTRQQAEETLDKLIKELADFDMETTEDRWVYTAGGMTFRERWEEHGIDAVSEDLVRAGVTCRVTRTKVPGRRAPDVDLEWMMPDDLRERLVMRQDDFDGSFSARRAR